jgi:hypothetical protein
MLCRLTQVQCERNGFIVCDKREVVEKAHVNSMDLRILSSGNESSHINTPCIAYPLS